MTEAELTQRAREAFRLFREANRRRIDPGDQASVSLDVAFSVGAAAGRAGWTQEALSRWLQSAYSGVWVRETNLSPGLDLSEVRDGLLRAWRRTYTGQQSLDLGGAISRRLGGVEQGSRVLPVATKWNNAELRRFLTPLRKVMEEVFSCDTVFGDCRVESPAAGHCLIAAQVVQDLLGGEILEGEVDEVPHYWNRVGQREVDLTGDQFGCAEVLVKRGRLREQSRVFPRAQWQQLSQGVNDEVCRKHVRFVAKIVPVLKRRKHGDLARALEQRAYRQ